MKYWIAPVICLAALAALTACGGDESEKDARVLAIESLSENAVDAWAADGPASLYNILHPTIKAECSAADFESALANQPRPTAWRSTKDITFLNDEKSAATATVVVVVDDQDTEQPWSFELESNVRWRVSDLPGLSGCGSQ